MIWRYDPILFSDKYTPEIHLKSFEKIASALGKYTEKCVFSFVDDRQREHCRCVKCDDIGSYDTCPHGCIYCYANFRPNIVADRIRAYDVHSPLLCDGIKETDKITERPVKSYKRRYEQLTLFD